MIFTFVTVALAASPFIMHFDSASSATRAKFFAILYIAIRILPYLVRQVGIIAGRFIYSKTQHRRELLLANVEKQVDELVRNPSTSTDEAWQGIVGFFHPFCNAGGGGERVLWAAIHATQKRWPRATCVVYTTDVDVDKTTMIQRVEDFFGIRLRPPTITFLYLNNRHYLLSSTWPWFTILGQSLGSMVLANNAFNLLVPDIFIDTMGYTFALALSKFFFPQIPTGAYLHYPVISTDMLDSLDVSKTKDGLHRGVNAGAGVGLKGRLKRFYWLLFAGLYSFVGSTVDVTMTNSTWTQQHVQRLWNLQPCRIGFFGSLVLSLFRSQNALPAPPDHQPRPVTAVFPPAAVEELTETIEISETTGYERGPYLLYIAQFRPEKNHELILRAFAELLNTAPTFEQDARPRLILLGSVRNSVDAAYVQNLRDIAQGLDIEESVDFICDATWPEMLHWLRRASIGVNGMWNEHFGIGVVEYQAAGLISVVNDSGGPRKDIVVDIDGKPTGFHATTAPQYAQGFRKALSLSPQEKLEMRQRARRSANRFTEEEFAKKWLVQISKLVEMQQSLLRD